MTLCACEIDKNIIHTIHDSFISSSDDSYRNSFSIFNIQKIIYDKSIIMLFAGDVNLLARVVREEELKKFNIEEIVKNKYPWILYNDIKIYNTKNEDEEELIDNTMQLDLMIISPNSAKDQVILNYSFFYDMNGKLDRCCSIAVNGFNAIGAETNLLAFAKRLLPVSVNWCEYYANVFKEVNRISALVKPPFFYRSFYLEKGYFDIKEFRKFDIEVA